MAKEGGGLEEGKRALLSQKQRGGAAEKRYTFPFNRCRDKWGITRLLGQRGGGKGKSPLTTGTDGI